MKKFIIMSMSIDEVTADDDGVFNSCAFGLVGSRALDTKAEAEEIRDQTIEQDKEDLEYNFTEEDGYTLEVEDGSYDDKELNVYYNGDLVNSTRYRIEEVEF